MTESGPIKRPTKTQPFETGFGDDFLQVTVRAWRITIDGKYWLLKSARQNDTASYVLLRREYELARNLQHPFILGAISFLESSPVGPAVLMEYVQGRSLDDFVKESPSGAARQKVLLQLLDAMEYLHRNGIVHQDLKAENILVTNIGDDVKIIDFGFSDQDADPRNYHLGGTSGSTAPEILSGENVLPAASSDIYSAGKLIQILFPHRFRDIVQRCLQEDPSRRYHDIHTLRRAILRRKRLPQTIALISAALLVAALSVHTFVQEGRKHKEEAQEQLIVKNIQDDLDVFYRQAADSLSDRSAVPDRMKAHLVRNTFVMRVVAYKALLPEQEQQFVCDTVYARMVTSLSEMMLSIPE